MERIRILLKSPAVKKWKHTGRPEPTIKPSAGYPGSLFCGRGDMQKRQPVRQMELLKDESDCGADATDSGIDTATFLDLASEDADAARVPVAGQQP